ncbi:hypothetical protein M501DRAFT_1009753 [Patellaria atrata CBS 101060]|uniref:Aminoglycoside phosphotransferase domain-containing protein n=1 Tax=Patellaria atrata CBS 101060 TaxID=1346257 RepID=A0A9P4S2Q6_9PEZI|nr:hypothetical protein M501DRAFT_1009753 [Patellaria atrata CBS 101060]
MASQEQEYSVDQEIAEFFLKTTATRLACDTRAEEPVGGNKIPYKTCVATPVWCGPDSEFVVQFRLKSLELKSETASLAHTIYGQLGESTDGKEAIFINVMGRVQGISHLDFILAHNLPENSSKYCIWRNNLIAPRRVEQTYRQKLGRRYQHKLQLLRDSLPVRFHPIFENALDSIPIILSLPMTLLHKDFGAYNIMVDSSTCHLVCVIDWAESEIYPFGLNLHSLQPILNKYNLRDGWIRYADYDGLQRPYDESGAYEMRGLYGLLIKAATKIMDSG